jgi:hypothetical protein
MSQAGIISIGAAGGVTSVTGNDGLTATPTTGAVQLYAKATGDRNIWLGEGAGVASPSASADDNTALGYHVLNALTDAQGTTAVGSGALDELTTGNFNTGIGFGAQGHVTTGAANVAVGRGSLNNLVSGSTNVCVGNSAGSVYTTTESNNICIGANTGVIADSAVIRIGTATQTTCYVGGIASVATSTTGSDVVTIDTTTTQMGSTSSPRIYRPIVTQSDSATLALTDAGTFQKCTKATAMTITVPANGTIAFATGTEIDIYQQGAGQVSIAAAGGVTINSVFGNLKIANQYTGASLKKTASDTWELVGNLTA